MPVCIHKNNHSQSIDICNMSTVYCTLVDYYKIPFRVAASLHVPRVCAHMYTCMMRQAICSQYPYFYRIEMMEERKNPREESE